MYLEIASLIGRAADLSDVVKMMDLDSVTDASDHKAKLDLYRDALAKLVAQPSPAAWQEFVDHGVYWLRSCFDWPTCAVLDAEVFAAT